jgi:hypothetical protein
MLATAEQAEETSFASGTGSIVIGGTRAKARLLAPVTDKYNFDEGGEEEEDTGGQMISFPKFSLDIQRVLMYTHMAIIETAKTALSIWQI